MRKLTSCLVPRWRSSLGNLVLGFIILILLTASLRSGLKFKYFKNNLTDNLVDISRYQSNFTSVPLIHVLMRIEIVEILNKAPQCGMDSIQQ